MDAMKIFEGLTNKQIATIVFGALMLIGVGYLVNNMMTVNRDNHIWNGVIDAVATAVPKSAITHNDSYAQDPGSSNADYCFEVAALDWKYLGAGDKRSVETALQTTVSNALHGTRFSTVRIHVIHYPIQNEPHICAPSQPLYSEDFTATVHPRSP